MTLIEAAYLAYTPHGQRHEELDCGLISPANLAAYRIEPLDEDIVATFDNKSTDANGGIVNFRGSNVRIDDFIEHGGNRVRSIISEVYTNDEGYTLLKTVNLIQCSQGTFIEVHPSIGCPDGSLVEPDAGSAWVEPGEHRDIVFFCQVADEATIPLPAAA